MSHTQVIINITQCTRGAVSANYASGQKLAVEAGVVSGLDMTVEAAYAKLSYLLGRPDLNQDERRQLIGRPLRGELTPPIVAQFKHSEADDKLHQLLLQTVDLHGSLNESRCSEMVTGNRLAEQEVHVIHDTLLPILLASAAGRSDGNLEKLLDQNHPVPLEVLNASGAVMRSPLHVAIQTGLLQNVAKLLAAGASVHLRDVALNCSALRLAASQGHVEIVRALLQAGAHLTETELQAVGAEVQQARTLGRQDLLEAWSEILTHAGVDRSVN